MCSVALEVYQRMTSREVGKIGMLIYTPKLRLKIIFIFENTVTYGTKHASCMKKITHLFKNVVKHSKEYKNMLTKNKAEPISVTVRKIYNVY